MNDQNEQESFIEAFLTAFFAILCLPVFALLLAILNELT